MTFTVVKLRACLSSCQQRKKRLELQQWVALLRVLVVAYSLVAKMAKTASPVVLEVLFNFV